MRFQSTHKHLTSSKKDHLSPYERRGLVPLAPDCLSVACPYCQATIGSACAAINDSGVTLVRVHRDRADLHRFLSDNETT